MSNLSQNDDFEQHCGSQESPSDFRNSSSAQMITVKNRKLHQRSYTISRLSIQLLILMFIFSSDGRVLIGDVSGFIKTNGWIQADVTNCNHHSLQPPVINKRLSSARGTGCWLVGGVKGKKIFFALPRENTFSFLLVTRIYSHYNYTRIKYAHAQMSDFKAECQVARSVKKFCAWLFRANRNATSELR